MSNQVMAKVTLVDGGGVFTDAAGDRHFIKGYGAGRDTHLDLDPRIDLTRPIWEQAQKLVERDPQLKNKA